MWKKVAIMLFAMIATISTGYALVSNLMNAAPANHPYYEYDEEFERTNQKTFTMGGIIWRIVYTDSSQGQAFILMDKNMVKEVGCGDSSGEWVTDNGYQTCMNAINSLYASGANDDMGEYIASVNPGLIYASPTMDEYDLITGNESSFSRISYAELWLDHYYQGVRVLYTKDVGRFQKVVYNGKTYKRVIINPDTAASELHPIAVIKLPKKGIIKTITNDISNLTKPYTDPINQAGTAIVNINTSEGEGPYHFYVYDTDASGNGTYTSPSSYFSLNPNSANGSAKVNLTAQLPVGDYYFKVKVIDECTDEALYYSSSDFTKDTYRTKETNVIHVKITKVTPTIEFDVKSDTKKTAAEAATNWNETATVTSNNSDVKITYSKVGGDIGLIDIDPDTGEITYKGNGAYGKVKI
ncbi:MAG: hypothetical protein HFE67_09100, partial [Erysipelotrichaceae bacterium]|nr:hypothetical protein [Erysipelotrichaceae bacterium]